MGVLEVIFIIFFLSLIGRKNIKSDYGTTTAADEEKVEVTEVEDGESLYSKRANKKCSAHQ